MAALTKNVSEMCSEKKYRIEVTVVTGFEDVAMEEAEEKLNTKVLTKQGRICFELPIEDVLKIYELKSANHCMVVMNHTEDFQFSDNEHNNLDRMRKLAGEIDWPTGLAVWSKFFSNKNPIKDTPDVIPNHYGEVIMLSNIKNSTESRAQKIKKKLKKKRNKSRNKQPSDAQQVNVLAANNQSDMIDNDLDSKDGDNCLGNLKESDNSGTVKTDEALPILEKGTGVSDQNNSIDRQSEGKANLKEDKNQEESQLKKTRTRLNPWNPLMPSFRVTCNRTGEGHTFNSMNVAANLGGGIYNYFGWNVKMTEMDIEVIVNITNKEMTVGIGLTREVLHQGNIKEFGSTTLRPSICYGLLRLCAIKPGDIVCDPMCGVGSIPIQGATNWQQSFHIGADIVGNATKRSRANFDHVNTQNVEKNGYNLSTDVLKWDTCNMPLRNQSVDVFVSDYPFGIRIGKKKDNWKLYNESLCEMARCSKPKLTRACILTEDKNCMIKTLQKVSKYWHRVKYLSVNIGGLSAGVYLLKRSSAPFEHNLEVKDEGESLQCSNP